MHVFRYMYIMQVVKKEYFPHGQLQFSFIFAFKEDYVGLRIPERGLELGGWMITPCYTPKVSPSLVEDVILLLQNKC